MTVRQRRILVVLAVINVIFLGALLLAATSLDASPLEVGFPTPVPTYQAPARLTPACRQQATQMVSDADLSGTILLEGETLRLDLVYRVTKDRSAEDAAQRVWTVFDIALGLADAGCEGFSRAETVIETQDGPETFRIFAATRLADLDAYRVGELDQETLIDRIEYRVD